MPRAHEMYTSVFHSEVPAWSCTPTPSPQLSEELQLAPEYHYPTVSPPSTAGSLPTISSGTHPSRRRASPFHIPRPRNAFMIFRSEHCSQAKITRSVEHDHRHISRIIGHLWNNLPEAEKEVYRARAEKEKLEHMVKYPHYRFAPGVREKKPIRRRVKRNGTEDLIRCKKVADLLMEGKEGDDLEVALMREGHSGSPGDEGLRSRSERTPRSPKASSTASSTCSSPSTQGWSPENGMEPERVDVEPAFLSPLLPPTELLVERPPTNTMQYPSSQPDFPVPAPPQQFTHFQATPTAWPTPEQIGQTDHSFLQVTDMYPNIYSFPNDLSYQPSVYASDFVQLHPVQSLEVQNDYELYSSSSSSSGVYNAAINQGPNPWYDDGLGLEVPSCVSVDPVSMWVDPDIMQLLA